MAGRNHMCEPPHAAFQGVHKQGTGSEAECPGLEPGTWIWDAGVASSSLTCCASVSTPQKKVLEETEENKVSDQESQNCAGGSPLRSWGGEGGGVQGSQELLCSDPRG